MKPTTSTQWPTRIRLVARVASAVAWLDIPTNLPKWYHMLWSLTRTCGMSFHRLHGTDIYTKLHAEKNNVYCTLVMFLFQFQGAI